MAQRDLLKPDQTADPTPGPTRERTNAEDFPKWVKPGKSFGFLTGGAQVVFLLIFFGASDTAINLDSTASNCYFGVTLMIFLGFGYLRAFLKAYGLGAVGFTMLIAALGMQWSLILDLWTRQNSLPLRLNSHALLEADLGAAAVLVSFGAMIGRISPTQIVMLVLMELPVYTMNKVYVVHQFDTSRHVRDGGSTIVVHVFGTYFGLAAAAVLGPPVKDRLKSSSYQSDVLSLIGTVFLWMFLPNFVAVGQATPDLQSKAMVNSILALLTSTVTTFGLTQILQEGKIGTRAVQNATLAGGVAIGATASIVGPFGAGLLGMMAGGLSTVAFAHFNLFKATDTCGIHNLHGLPGLLGGLFSIISPVFYNDTGLNPFEQMIALGATLTLSLVTGAICGLAMKAVEQLHDDKDLRTAAARIGLDPSDLHLEPFSDAAFWTGEGDAPVIEL